MTSLTRRASKRNTRRHLSSERGNRPGAGQNRTRTQPHTVSAERRHYFAYANIERWMAQGKDVTALLPYLSRYMGHATFESTFYYIHTSPDFMDAYAQITRRSETLLPEVGFE
jgi:integrase